MSKLKEALDALGLGKGAGSGEVRVLVALRQPQPDAATLARLRALGLTIEKVVRSTLIGRCPAAVLDKLRADPAVGAVERSVPLELKPGKR